MTMSPSLTLYLVAKVNRAFAKGFTPHVTPQVKLFDPNASSSYVRPYISFTIPPPLSLFEGRGHDRKTLDSREGSNKDNIGSTKKRPERGTKPLGGKFIAQISVEGD
ncbi:hypothetical protein D5086_024840 [Populus alba]|uniref:Uncharacterized protein n=1 Tax=Populus alba TaxID=43335 RepID=A0ACC4B6N3_POPAL